jgi:hypothetical protein
MDLDVEIAHKPSGKTRFEHWLAILIGAAAIVAASLATLEMHSNKRWEQASTEAADLSVELFGKIAATGPVRAAGVSTQQTALTLDLRATARSQHPDAKGFQIVMAYVDSEVARRLLKLGEEITASADRATALDPVAREVIATNIERLGEIGDEQDHQVGLAEKYGGRLSRALFALSLLALAAILLGLAAVLGIQHGGPIILGVAALALLLAGGWGGSALLI